MPRFLKSGQFWAGVVTGAIVGPWAMQKFAPGMKAKLPAQQ
jgi:hypothetical protein